MYFSLSQDSENLQCKSNIFQVALFVICNVPQQIVYLLSYFGMPTIRQDWMTVLIFLNPVVDAITFFVIYRHIWRRSDVWGPNNRPSAMVVQEEQSVARTRNVVVGFILSNFQVITFCPNFHFWKRVLKLKWLANWIMITPGRLRLSNPDKLVIKL